MRYTKVKHSILRCFFLHRNTASILVFTMWVLAFFSILSVSVYRLVISHLNFTRALEERTVSHYLAGAACKYFQHERKKDGLSYDSLYLLRKKTARELGRIKFNYYLVDEESKININTASSDILARVHGLNKELADAITNSSLRPFHMKEELLLVDGVTQEVFTACKDYITVYGKGQVNINTSSKEVLIAIGMDEALYEAIQGYRAGADGQEATKDDNVFVGVSEIAGKVRAFGGLSPSEEAMLDEIMRQGLLGVKGENFCIVIETTVSGRPAMHYQVVLDANSIKQWEES